jgi:Transposase DDE domain group 1
MPVPLLLGATDRTIGMMKGFASCFDDLRRPDLIEHQVVTLVGQRVFGIALGYEGLDDHHELRHDPIMAALAGKLEARREECAPVAGKSTLNRLELSKLEPTRYHKISHNAERSVMPRRSDFRHNTRSNRRDHAA